MAQIIDKIGKIKDIGTNNNSKVVQNINMDEKRIKDIVPEDLYILERFDLPYTVEYSDTLWSIARKKLGEGATDEEIATYVQKIAQNNNISNPDEINVGQEIIFPVENKRDKESSSSNPDTSKTNTTIDTNTNNSNTYTVEAGDTLWAIAKKDLGPEASDTEILEYINILKEYNNIPNPNEINISQEINIPPYKSIADKNQYDNKQDYYKGLNEKEIDKQKQATREAREETKEKIQQERVEERSNATTPTETQSKNNKNNTNNIDEQLKRLKETQQMIEKSKIDNNTVDNSVVEPFNDYNSTNDTSTTDNNTNNSNGYVHNKISEQAFEDFNNKRTSIEKTATAAGKNLTSQTIDDAAVYGTFSNGYQPRGIKDHGILEVASTNSIKVNENIQNIWKASDNTYWYWNGNAGEYWPYDGTFGKFTDITPR